MCLTDTVRIDWRFTLYNERSNRLRYFCAAIVFCLASLSVPSDASSPWKLRDNTLPLSSGPGIQICDPITTSKDPNILYFGEGCALWLQYTVGGQPEFGKTPILMDAGGAASEMGRADLQLTAAQAVNLAPTLGVTHAAVGTLKGNLQKMTLTYRLLKVPQGTQVGAAITLQGTSAQVVEGLPKLARTLAVLLGKKSPDIPETANLSTADIELLGNLRWIDYRKMTNDQKTNLASLSTRCPLGYLLGLSHYVYQTETTYRHATNNLIDHAGNNAIAWGQAISDYLYALEPFGPQLSRLTARYPGNINLAYAETYRYASLVGRPEQLKAARRMTLDAPNNPLSWFVYASALTNTASDLRQARTFNNLTSTQATYLIGVYSEWENADKKAVQLDPKYSLSWNDLAVAATFNGDDAVARQALQTAIDLKYDRSAIYGWALEMYQDKWGGDPATLSKFARMAASDPAIVTSDEVVYVATELENSGFTPLAQQLVDNFITRRTKFLVTHPNDGEARRGLATVLKFNRDYAGAMEQLIRAESLLPDNPRICVELGELYYSPTTYDKALEQFQKALKLDPEYATGHYMLGYLYKDMNRLKDAEVELQTSIRLKPGDPKAYAALGSVESLQNDLSDAVTNLNLAIQFGDYSVGTYRCLVWSLDNSGKYDQALAVGDEALRTHPDGDVDIYDDLSDVYLHKKSWEESLSMSNKALALNPADPLAYENLGEAYLGEGSIDKARDEWKKVITLNNSAISQIAEGYLKKYP